ncbi:MAG TPA: S-layer protein, partial [Humibacillus sp.]|nr:S-layer protein [Humibacillus sp.]
FVRDTQTGATQMASVTPTGTSANAESFQPSLSGDGRYVVFRSGAWNLVGTETKGIQNVFRRDLSTGTTQLVSADSFGNPANSAAGDPSMSADGQRVSFSSAATNLVADPDFAPYNDIIVKDLQTWTFVRVSTTPDGRAGNRSSNMSQISGDGTHVAFSSSASNLLPQDSITNPDAFLATLP